MAMEKRGMGLYLFWPVYIHVPFFINPGRYFFVIENYIDLGVLIHLELYYKSWKK